MLIKTLPVGQLETNCYIVGNENTLECVVIDPGDEANTILNYIESCKYKCVAILLTHGHFDHVGAVRTLAAETECRVYLNEQDLSMPTQLTAGPLYYTHLYKEGDVLNLAGVKLRVIHTPGHTPGSVCLVAEDAIFSGDTLFEGSCGRTDLPGGDWATILKSLKRLAQMEGAFRVYPGHGPSTTLEDEKKWNPYMRQ